MLLLLVVLLTIIGIALRIIIVGLDVAYFVAARAEDIRRKTGKVVTKAITRKGSWQRKVAKVTGFGLNSVGNAAKLTGYVAKSVVIFVLRKTIKLIKFIVDRLRDAILALSTFVLVLDILVFTVLVAGSAGFLALYCKTDKNGNIVFDEDVLKLLDQNDASSDDGTSEGGLTEEEVQDLILKTCKKITDYVRANNYVYGDAPINPCMDKSVHKISCDRFVDWVLYDLGWTDQPKSHGPVVRSSNPKMDLSTLCENWGFTKIKSLDDIKPGDIMFQGTSVPVHTYIIGRYHEDQKLWDRYDCGSDARITGDRPSPSIEPINDFLYAYRMDYKKLGLGTKKSSGGSSTFTSYDMSKDDIAWLTRLCEAENDSSNKAIAAEISTAMNLWEARHPEESLRTYCNRPLSSEGWFAPRSRDKANGGSGYESEDHYKIVEAATKGKRIYPKYVDEHDCYSDISSIKINGQEVGVSKSNLKKNESVITNVYGSVWIFYDLPDPSSDPFGYKTDEGVRLRKQYGEAHYDWDKLKSELGIGD